MNTSPAVDTDESLAEFREVLARSERVVPVKKYERVFTTARRELEEAIVQGDAFGASVRADLLRRIWPQAAANKPTKEAKQIATGVRGLQTAADVDLAALLQPNYVVKPWLYRGANAVMFGEWNAGKTFVALSLSIHVAAAMAWLGCRVKQAPVLYLTYEGARGFGKRVAALRQQFAGLDWAKLPFAWQILRHPLITKEGKEELQSAVKDFHARFGAAPGLVVIDPLQDALGGNDSDPELMGKLNALVLGLIASYGCAVLRLHHSGHGDKTRGRGHSSLPASADTEIRVTDGLITATKQRDDDKGELAFKRVVVELGVDQDGDKVTTCVIEPAEAAQDNRSKHQPPKGLQRDVWSIAQTLAGLGDGTVSVDAVIDRAMQDMVPPGEGKRDRRPYMVHRVLGILKESGYLRVVAGKLSLTGGRG